jgi:hypothetical protein
MRWSHKRGALGSYLVLSIEHVLFVSQKTNYAETIKAWHWRGHPNVEGYQLQLWQWFKPRRLLSFKRFKGFNGILWSQRMSQIRIKKSQENAPLIAA